MQQRQRKGYSSFSGLVLGCLILFLVMSLPIEAVLSSRSSKASLRRRSDSQEGSRETGIQPTILTAITQAELTEIQEALSSQSLNFAASPRQDGGDRTGSRKAEVLHGFISELKKLKSQAHIQDLRCSAVPLRIQLIRDKEVICNSHGAANLISLYNVTKRNGRLYGQLLIHKADGSLMAATNLSLPLARLSPQLFGDDSTVDEKAFKGTALCRESGGRLEVIQGWPGEPDAHNIQRAAGRRTIRGLLNRVFRRDSKKMQKSPAIDVFLLVYSDQGEAGRPVTPVTVKQSLEKGRDQAYRLLKNFMLRRAYLECITLQPSLTNEAEVARIERMLHCQIRKIEWVSLLTGLRIGPDGMPELPVGFNLQRLHNDIVVHLHSLIHEMTEGPAKPQFPLDVLKLKNMMAALSRHFADLCKKVGVHNNCDAFINKINPKSLGILYETLKESAAIAQDTRTLDFDSKRVILQVQAEEEARFWGLLEKAVTKEALIIRQEIAKADNKQNKAHKIMELQPRIQELRETLMTTRLSGKLIHPAEEIISYYWQESGN